MNHLEFSSLGGLERAEKLSADERGKISSDAAFARLEKKKQANKAWRESEAGKKWRREWKKTPKGKKYVRGIGRRYAPKRQKKFIAEHGITREGFKNRETIKMATQAYERWDESDNAILFDPTITNRERAKRLGRSLASVVMRRHLLTHSLAV